MREAFWRFARLINLRASGRMMVHCVMVGVVAGCGALVFQWLLEHTLHTFLDGVAGFRAPPTAGEPAMHAPTDTPYSPYWLVAVTTLGGLASGLIVFTFAPSAEGHGTDAAIEALHSGRGEIPPIVPLVKTIASSITLGTGGSGGREGPIAQIGAGFGSFLARRLHLSSKDSRMLVAAGMGAGVGAIFRAPLAGALFAAEVLYLETEFETEVLMPATIASITAYSLYASIFGWAPLFKTPMFSFNHPVELISYALLGVLCALAGYVYIRIFYGTRDLFKLIPLPNHLKPALGGFLMGLVGVMLPEAVRMGAVSMGYGSLQLALLSHLGAGTLLAIAGVKMFTTALSIGSGGSAGIFGPSMVIGGSLGGAVGLWLHDLSPTLLHDPGSFVIVGMAGFFAGAAHTPISTLIMVSEMTGNYQLLVPAMLTTSIAFMLLPRWSIYENQVENSHNSPVHRHEFEVDILEELTVESCMVRVVQTIPEDASFHDIVETVMSRTHSNYPVLDRSGRLVGVLCFRDIRQFALDGSLTDVAVAGDLMEVDFVTVRPGDSLHEAMQRIGTGKIELLVVVSEDTEPRLLGVITRSNIVAAYSRELRRRRATVEGDDESSSPSLVL